MSTDASSVKSTVARDRILQLRQKHAALVSELQELKAEYTHVEAEVNELIRKSDLKSILEKISSI